MDEIAVVGVLAGAFSHDRCIVLSARPPGWFSGGGFGQCPNRPEPGDCICAECMDAHSEGLLASLPFDPRPGAAECHPDVEEALREVGVLVPAADLPGLAGAADENGCVAGLVLEFRAEGFEDDGASEGPPPPAGGPPGQSLEALRRCVADLRSALAAAEAALRLLEGGPAGG